MVRCGVVCCGVVWCSVVRCGEVCPGFPLMGLLVPPMECPCTWPHPIPPNTLYKAAGRFHMRLMTPHLTTPHHTSPHRGYVQQFMGLDEVGGGMGGTVHRHALSFLLMFSNLPQSMVVF